MTQRTRAGDAGTAITGTDSLINLMAGLGTSRDKRTSSSYEVYVPRNIFELQNAYGSSWLASRIVQTPADDMTREWISHSWEGQDDDENGVQELKEAETTFRVRHQVNQALRNARLFGGSVIVIGIKGQADTSKPLDLNTVKKDSLDYMHVFDRWRIAPSGKRTEELSSPNFGLPDEYVLAESGSNVPRVHWTRVIRFNGRPLPYFLWQQNGMWDESELAHILDNIKDYDATKAGIASMVWESCVDIIKTTGLAQKLATAGGEKDIMNRYLLAAQQKSYNRMLLIDKDKEDYTQKNITFAGVNDVLMRMMIDICGAADIPTTRLFGQSPAGMTATGESDTRNYYDHIASKQETQLRPQLDRLYSVLVRSTFGSMPKNFKIDFNPLWQVSDKERGEIDKNWADMVTALITDGVITEELAAKELLERRTFRTQEDSDVRLVAKLAKEARDNPPAPPANQDPNDPNVAPDQKRPVPKGVADSRVGDTIRRDENGWNVYAEAGGKHLGGPYKTRAEALRRLSQVEFYKER